MIRLAAIGVGLRLAWVIKQVQTVDPEVRLVAAVDPDPERVRKWLTEYKAADVEGLKFYPSVEAMLERADTYDAFMIGTRCHLHTPMAVKIAPAKKPLYLEKPVAITNEQVRDLARAYKGREDQVVVSYPLRASPLWRRAREIIDSGRLGTINQIQAINNVPYGGVYFGEWYRNYDEVGGLWLQKATHDFDYINHLAGAPAKTIAATITRKIYGGDHPHDLKCSKCDETETCVESPKNIAKRGDGGGMGKDDHWCAFSREIKNEDAGSALIKYANGVHANYTQNFITRKSAGTRGATITGYSATLSFDWYTDKIRVTDHHIPDKETEVIDVKCTEGHSGGDAVLARAFVDLIREKRPSTYSLRDGIISSTMCLAARESSGTDTFQRVPDYENLAQK
jgi:predicted dehydrogenase